MVKHHPDNNMLVEYAAGNLEWGLSLMVSAHLQMCLQCRRHVHDLNHVGGTLLESCAAEQPNKASFDSLMNRIRQLPDAPPEKAKTEKRQTPAIHTNDPLLVDLPPIVRKLLPGDKPLKWKYVSPALKTARLAIGQDRYEVAFHRMRSGGKAAEHDHRGLEVTLVLNGSFSDSEGVYTPGDFLVRYPGEVHRPTATQDQECLCLTAVEAPVAMTGLMGWLVNPFLSVKPA